MSALPLYLSLLDDLTPASIFDQDFGMGVVPNNVILYNAPHRHSHRIAPSAQYLRPWRHLHEGQSGVSNVVDNKDAFKVSLDVQQFKPEQISVKVVDNHVVIEGKHEERQDEHGYISRQFTRRYLLPKDVEVAQVQSQLSSDGVLSIIAPKKQKAIAGNTTEIPIVHTNQPALRSPEEPKKNQPTTENMEQ